MFGLIGKWKKKEPERIRIESCRLRSASSLARPHLSEAENREPNVRPETHNEGVFTFH